MNFYRVFLLCHSNLLDQVAKVFPGVPQVKKGRRLDGSPTILDDL